MLTLWQDVRYALRMLSKSAGFSAVVILTLALGIGANTAIFSVISAVLLRPLPFSQSERLVALHGIDLRTGETGRPLSYPDFSDLRTQSQSMESASAYDVSTSTITSGGEPLHIDVGVVSANFLSVLRAKPMLGREFAATEDNQERMLCY